MLFLFDMVWETVSNYSEYIASAREQLTGQHNCDKGCIKYSNWSEFFGYSHPCLPAEFVTMYPSKSVSE